MFLKLFFEWPQLRSRYTMADFTNLFIRILDGIKYAGSINNAHVFKTVEGRGKFIKDLSVVYTLCTGLHRPQEFGLKNAK